MPESTTAVRVRPLDELDITGIVRIDEKISGIYRPEVWEERVMYYTRRDPGASQVAEAGGRVVGFMLGDLRAGEFGIDPDFRGQDLGRRMFDAIRAHFAAEGAKSVRTLVDTDDDAVAGFLRAIGFQPAPLQALELKL
jgi:ribosomal protein S18 acetylase RimI-like enzyme